MPGQDNFPWESLCAAILRQAVVDARDRRLDRLIRMEARNWLKSRNALILAEIVGMDTTLLPRWVDAGCPSPEKSKTMFGQQYGFRS